MAFGRPLSIRSFSFRSIRLNYSYLDGVRIFLHGLVMSALVSDASIDFDYDGTCLATAIFSCDSESVTQIFDNALSTLTVIFFYDHAIVIFFFRGNEIAYFDRATCYEKTLF